MNKANRWIIGLATLFTLIGSSYLFSMEPSKMAIEIQTKDQLIPLRVELAITTEEKSKGLMYRKKLANHTGMLFWYEQSQKMSFWMKNMEIPIDILFIDPKGKINQIYENAQPCPPKENCPLIQSEEPARYVLEVPALYTKREGIKEGDIIKFKSKISEWHIGPNKT